MSIPVAWLFRTTRARLGFLTLSLYAAIYFALSVSGGYRDNVRSLADLGINIKGISDRVEWQPAFIIVTHFPGQDSALRANTSGYVFMPLVWLDQHLGHKTQPMATAGYGSAAYKYARSSDYLAACVFVGVGAWWLLFPGQAIRFYCWVFGGKLKRPTPLVVRFAGTLWMVMVSSLLLTLLSSR